MLLDANNLYGGIMEKFPLPLNEFETLQQINLEDILNTANDSEEGQSLEVDLHYGDKRPDGHQAFSLPPTMEESSYKALGRSKKNCGK